MKFGDKLRAARLAANLTQEELAIKAGVNRARIAQIENNYFGPSPETVKKFVSIFDDPSLALHESVSQLLLESSRRLTQLTKDIRDKNTREMAESLERLSKDVLQMVQKFN